MRYDHALMELAAEAMAPVGACSARRMMGGATRGGAEAAEGPRRSGLSAAAPAPAGPAMGQTAALAVRAASIASIVIRRASSASPHSPIRTHFSDSRSL